MSDADEDDFAVDPALAASLGFSSFGTQPSAKKRKYTHHDAFVDTSATAQLDGASKEAGKGANALPLGRRKNLIPAPSVSAPHDETMPVLRGAPLVTELSTVTPGLPLNITNSVEENARPIPSADVGIEAYRHGVRQANGDVAYFLPSFLEDPWEELRRKRVNASGGQIR